MATKSYVPVVLIFVLFMGWTSLAAVSLYPSVVKYFDGELRSSLEIVVRSAVLCIS